MNRIAVLYATQESHTAKIAQRIASDLRIRGFEADEYELKGALPDVDLDGAAAVVVAGSVHAGRHEPELIQFVKENRAQLDRMPSAFISVTLSEVGDETPDQTPEDRARFAREVQAVIDRFVATTGWYPTHTRPMSGAIRYTGDNILVRLIVQRIARRVGSPADTSREYVYTDWVALDGFVEELADEITASCEKQSGSPRPAPG